MNNRATEENELQIQITDVVALVEEASRLALEWQGRCNAEVKDDNTLVTAADRAIEEFLRARLAQLAPGTSFLGEEGGLSGDTDAPCWVIDPIDGTTNFVRGVPLWCISVGLVHRNEVLLGVISVPPQRELLWATRGGGAWWRGTDNDNQMQMRPLHARTPQELIQEDLIACNTSVEEAVDFSRVPCRLRNFGTLAYHLTLLARGTVCASLAHWHKLYDIAAGMCLCIEAGCSAQYLDGRVWTADITPAKARVPLMVAPPSTLQVLAANLVVRNVALERGDHTLVVGGADSGPDASDY